MKKQTRRKFAPAFKAKVALEAVKTSKHLLNSQRNLKSIRL